MKKNTNGGKILFLTLAALLITAGLMYLNGKTFSKGGITVTNENTLIVEGQLEATASSDLIYYIDNMLLEIQGSVLRAKKIDGESVWSLNFGKNIKQVKQAGSNIVILDDTGILNYMTKQGKLLWEQTLKDNLLDIYCDDNGYVLAEYKGDTGSEIQVFSNKGISVGQVVLENAYIIGFTASKGEKYTISVLDITSDKVKSKLITYDIRGGMLWAKDFQEELISYIKYMKSNNLLAVRGNNLVRYKEDGTEADNIELEGELKRIAANEGMIAAIVNERGNYYCLTLDGNMKKQGEIELDMIPDGISVYKNNYILYNKGSIIVGHVNGSIVASYKTISDILASYMTSEEDIYIVSNRKLQHLGYR